MQKHNKFVFNKTIGPTFNFEAIDIHHHSCSSSYNLPNGLRKTIAYIYYNLYQTRYGS